MRVISFLMLDDWYDVILEYCNECFEKLVGVELVEMFRRNELSKL